MTVRLQHQRSDYDDEFFSLFYLLFPARTAKKKNTSIRKLQYHLALRSFENQFLSGSRPKFERNSIFY
jgi:hypothetical protein